VKSLIILGRQPSLGLAELESLFGADALVPIGREAVGVTIDAKDIPFQRLGGSIKLAKVLTRINSTKWRDIELYLSKSIPEHLSYLPVDGKLKLGLSAYDLRVRAQDINITGLRLKKIIKAKGRSVRVVPNKSSALNSAQVLHNQLTGELGWELIAVRDGDDTILAQTIAEQDIEAYAKRDQNRPMRDAKVGMLPPKLAQIIINLATGRVEETSNQKIENRILDPFCGTGVLLQEALLMGFDARGSDIDPRMIEYSTKNLAWLKDRYGLHGRDYQLHIGDATTFTWDAVKTVACETFLGKPLTSIAPSHVMNQIIKECDLIHEKFLRNIASQLVAGARLCLAVPAWRLNSSFLHLKTLDRLDDLGYTRLSFVHARNQDLIYHRPDQVVARELVVLEKK
jgi:tRNA G10  N-methylase Trm11